MNYIRKTINSLKSYAKDYKNKDEGTQSVIILQLILCLFFAFAIIYLLLTYFSYIIKASILFCFIVGCIYSYYKKMQYTNQQYDQLLLNQQEFYCKNVLFSVLTEICDKLGVLKPTIPEKLLLPGDIQPLTNGVVLYTASLLRNNTTTGENSSIYPYILQREIEKQLQTVYFVTPLNYNSNYIPIQVLDIKLNQAYLIIEFVYVNNNVVQEYVNYVKSNQRPQLSADTEISVITQMSTSGVPVCFNEEILPHDKQSSTVYWNFTSMPHALIVGNSGSGKTSALLLLLNTVLSKKYIQNSTVFIIDYKGEDFKFAENYTSYFSYTNCSIGIDNIYHIMKSRQDGSDKTRTPYFVLFDEMGAFILSLSHDKKTQDKYKSIIAEILMLGRSLGIHMIISLQRPDSSFFLNGARENLQNSFVVLLGNSSKEAQRMLFADFADKMENNRTVGTGYCLNGGCEFSPIKIPKINKIELEHRIKRALNINN